MKGSLMYFVLAILFNLCHQITWSHWPLVYLLYFSFLCWLAWQHISYGRRDRTKDRTDSSALTQLFPHARLYSKHHKVATMGVYLILLSTILITASQGGVKRNTIFLKSECRMNSALIDHSLAEVPFFLPPSFKTSSHSAVSEGREEDEQWEQHPHLHSQRGSLTIGSRSF